MPFVSAEIVLKTLPPVLVEYHFILVPVAVKFSTVPLLQKLWETLPVGAAGALMVAVTARRVADSQPLTVCVA